jgi:hypothetical protein
LEVNAAPGPLGEESTTEQEISSFENREEHELSFTFPAKNDAEKGESRNHGEVRLSGRKPEPRFATPSDSDNSEPWSMSGAEKLGEKPFTINPPRMEKKNPGQAAAAQPPSSTEANPASEEAADNIFPIHTFRDQAVSTVPYLTLFGLLLIFFSLGTAYLEAHPKITETVIGRIPLIGPSLLRNGYLKNGVLLKSLRADYQTILGNREVLVVRGEAVNQNPVVIRELRVVGRLYNENGKTLERQVIWVGNALSLKIIRGMSAQDIADLQRLKPLKSFEVPPGDSISFAIVFLRPAKDVKSFACEVLSAEGEI